MSITFYGHFSGWSSYPVVCRAISTHLWREGVDHEVCDLRPGPGYLTLQASEPEPVPYKPVSKGHRESVLRTSAMLQITDMEHAPPLGPAPGIGLVFGFPEWVSAVPQHEVMLGYHVCDFEAIPPHWVTIMNAHLGRVLTPSYWCHDAFRNAGVETPITVIPHGFDPRIFRPAFEEAAEPKSILHLCSALDAKRKGTRLMLDTFALPELEGWTLTIRTQSPHVAQWVRAHPRRVDIRIDTGHPMPPTEMARYYRQFELTVAPSIAEGFGMVPLETAACGCKIVHFAATGCRMYERELPGSRVRTNVEALCHDIQRATKMEELTGARNVDLQRLQSWHWSRVLQPLSSLLRSLA